MKSDEYWTERFVILEKSQINKGAEFYAELKKQYRMAEEQTEKEVTKWLARIAINNEISMDEAKKLLKANELEEFHWTVEEYIEKGKSLNYSSKWARELENASAKIHISKLEAMQMQMRQQVESLYAEELPRMKTFLTDIYQNGFYRTSYEIQKGVGVGINLNAISNKKVEQLLLKPWAPDGSNFSDRIWKQKAQLLSTLQNGMTQALILGKNPEDVIKQIKERFQVSSAQAGRLVMTETAFFHSASQLEMYKELGVNEYQIEAVMDKKTSEICQKMDGKHRPISEFRPGVTAPPFHCWCRSTTIPYLEDEFTIGGTRAARDENGKTIYVPADITYKEWKEKFVDRSPQNVIMEAAKMYSIRGIVATQTENINVKNYSYDEQHINEDRKHNITREEAERLIKEAVVSVTRWNGRFINYYGENGAVYIDTEKKVIRTAFRKEEYDDNTREFMEVVLNAGK